MVTVTPLVRPKATFLSSYTELKEFSTSSTLQRKAWLINESALIALIYLTAGTFLAAGVVALMPFSLTSWLMPVLNALGVLPLSMSTVMGSFILIPGLIVAVVAASNLANIEERFFRLDSESRSLGGITLLAFTYGAMHPLLGLPLFTLVTQMVFGLLLSVVYQKTYAKAMLESNKQGSLSYRAFAQDRALEASRYLNVSFKMAVLLLFLVLIIF